MRKKFKYYSEYSESLSKLFYDLEEQARREREEQVRREREEQARREREEQVRREREEQARREREEQARREREEQARREREEQARREREDQARREREEQARREHEEQARREREEQARREREEQARREREQQYNINIMLNRIKEFYKYQNVFLIPWSIGLLLSGMFLTFTFGIIMDANLDWDSDGSTLAFWGVLAFFPLFIFDSLFKIIADIIGKLLGKYGYYKFPESYPVEPNSDLDDMLEYMAKDPLKYICYYYQGMFILCDDLKKMSLKRCFHDYPSLEDRDGIVDLVWPDKNNKKNFRILRLRKWDNDVF